MSLLGCTLMYYGGIMILVWCYNMLLWVDVGVDMISLYVDYCFLYDFGDSLLRHYSDVTLMVLLIKYGVVSIS